MELIGGRSYLTESPWTRDKLLKQTSAADLLMIEGEIEIGQLREVLSQWSGNPFGRLRLLYINRAEAMSLLCQTTLLKALEEPSLWGAILLHCARPDNLLPTVRSRLHLLGELVLRQGPAKETALPVMEDKDATTSLRAFKDRPSALAFFTQLIAELKARILQKPSYQLVRQIRLAESAAVRLAHNANWKLTIDRFLQDWPEKGKE